MCLVLSCDAIAVQYVSCVNCLSIEEEGFFDIVVSALTDGEDDDENEKTKTEV